MSLAKFRHPRQLLSSRTLKTAISLGVVVLGGGLMQGVMGLSPVIIARRVSPGEFGQFAACTGLLSLLLAFPNYGLENWLLAQGGQTRPQLGALWRSAFKLRGLLLLIWIGGLLSVGWFLPQATYPFQLLTLTAGWLALESLALPCISVLRVLNHQLVIAIWQASTALSLLAGVLLTPSSSAYLLWVAGLWMGIKFVATSAILSYTYWQVHQQYQPYPVAEVWRAARPFVMGDVAVLIYSKSDAVILALVGGSAIMGIYGPATSIVTMTFIVGTGIYAFVLPKLGAAYTHGPSARFWRLGLGQLGVQGLAGLAIMFGVILLAPFMIGQVFGPAYRLTSPILQLMSPVIFLKYLNLGLAALITSTQNQNTRTRVQVSLAFLNIITTLVGVLGWGVIGAVVADVVTEVCLFLGYAGAVWKIKQGSVSRLVEDDLHIP